MYRRSPVVRFFPPLLVSLTLLGCATFPGDMEGAFSGSATATPAGENVTVLFLLRHVKQAKGLDAIPKLVRESQIVRDFDNLFVDAVQEIENLGSFASFTEFPSDVSDPERVARRDELIRTYDYLVKVQILEENSFVKEFFGGLVSTLTLAMVPVPFSTHYSIEVEVIQGDRRVSAYNRSSSKTTWLQAFLIFIQPFHNDTIVRERIYIDLLHDVFREMNADRVLR